MSLTALPKGLTENQAKVMDYFSPEAEFTRGDLVSLTRMQANALTAVLRSLVVRGLLEEFVDEDDQSLTVHYRLPVPPDAEPEVELPIADPNVPAVADADDDYDPDAPATEIPGLTDDDDLPANTTPEDVADMVLDLGDGAMMSIDLSDEDVLAEPTAAELNAQVTAENAPVAMPELAEVVKLVLDVQRSGHPDTYGQAVKLARDAFGVYHIGQTVHDAQAVIFRARIGKPFPGDPPLPEEPESDDPLQRAIRDEHDTWLDLSKDGSTRSTAEDYITTNIKLREDFATRLDGDIRPAVRAFLGPIANPGNAAIQAALAKSQAKKEERAANKPKANGNGGTPRVKTDFSSEATGEFTVIHGEIKGKMQYAGWWVASNTYMRTVATAASTGFVYNPQLLASTAEKVIEKARVAFPNATYNGQVVEQDGPKAK